MADDRMIRPFFEALFRLAHTRLRWWAHAYVHCDWRSWAAVWESAKRVGMVPKNCLVWDKGGAGLGANYANAHELVGFFAKLPPQKGMTDAKSRHGKQRPVHAPNILRFSRVSEKEREHNAAKPVPLLRELVTNSTDRGEVAFDPFLGSGSTLIACELEGRACLGVDVEPRWVDVAVRRWEALTGQKATR